ncbi:MAG: hypothetical protein ABEH77_08315 [Halobacteriaceae archaeon]
MRRAVKALAGLLAGATAFLLVGNGVSAALAPHVSPSAMVGLPAGFAAGVAAVSFAYFGLSYWEELTDRGEPSRRTLRSLRATAAAVAGFVVGSGAVTLVFAPSTGAVGVAETMLLAGFAAGVVLAAAAAHRVLHRDSPTAPGSWRE